MAGAYGPSQDCGCCLNWVPLRRRPASNVGVYRLGGNLERPRWRAGAGLRVGIHSRCVLGGSRSSASASLAFAYVRSRLPGSPGICGVRGGFRGCDLGLRLRAEGLWTGSVLSRSVGGL